MSGSQQKQQNVNIQGLSYSNSEFDSYNPVIRATTTTTAAPEITTKKGGFFSGLAFWKKDKNKENEGEEAVSSTVPTTTGKLTTPSSVTTPRQVPVTPSTPKQAPAVPSTTPKAPQTASTIPTSKLVVSTPPTVPVTTPRAQQPLPPQNIPFTQKVVVQNPSTTTARPISTTRKAPVASFDDFPALPTKKPASGQPGQASGPTTPQNPWTATPGKPGVQFIPNAGTTTQRTVR